MTIFHLSKQGYGTVEQIKAMDTPEFLDLVEYERICADIDHHKIQNAGDS